MNKNYVTDFRTPLYATTTPTARDAKDGWRHNHEQNVNIALHTTDEVCLIGASIIKGLTRYANIWKTLFRGATKAVNFGIGGDRTQHALWRVINGEVPHNTKYVVINIGNNNLDRDPPVEIANGIINIGLAFQKTLPDVKVLLVGLLPRDQGYSYRRHRQNTVNEHLHDFCQRNDVAGFHYLPPATRFAPGEEGHVDQNLS